MRWTCLYTILLKLTDSAYEQVTIILTVSFATVQLNVRLTSSSDDHYSDRALVSIQSGLRLGL